jgi:hypothetical protein
MRRFGQFLFVLFNLFWLTISPGICQTIEYRVNNPRVIKIGGDYFQYDIEVRSNPSEYCWAVQANFYYNTDVFGANPAVIVTRLGITNTKIPFFNTDKYTITSNINTIDHTLNIYVTPITAYGTGQSDVPFYYELIPTTWTSIAQVNIPISNSAGGTGETGVYFFPTYMTVSTNQTYVTSVS